MSRLDLAVTFGLGIRKDEDTLREWRLTYREKRVPKRHFEPKSITSCLPLALIGNASGQTFWEEGDLDPRRFR